MPTNSLAIDDIGSGWPVPTEPGVPAEALRHGYHWLAYHNDGAVIVGQWSPDARSWLVNSAMDRLCPEEMGHMNYLGPCLPPGGSR
jgi:hypothetical protein